MQKKKPIGLLTGAIALALLVTSVFVSTAFAANTASANNSAMQENVTAPADTNPDTASRAAATTDSVTEAADSTDKQDAAEAENEAQDKAKETAENTTLATKAKVTEQEAIQIAEKANSGYTFIVDELGSDNGVIAYELKGTNADGKKLEVHVDAVSGALLQESDSEYNN